MSSSSLALLLCSETIDPKGKATAPIPPYHRDARKGYPPSRDLPHAGPEPSGDTLPSILSGKFLDGSRGTFSFKAEGMQHTCDPPKIDDESIYDLGGGSSAGPMEDSVECCIVATFTDELGIPCHNPDCPKYTPDMGYTSPDPS